VILEDHLAGAFEPDPEAWWARGARGLLARLAVTLCAYGPPSLVKADGHASTLPS
jgi:hypothetical protein